MGKRKEIEAPALIKPDANEKYRLDKRRKKSENGSAADEDSVALTLLTMRSELSKKQKQSFGRREYVKKVIPPPMLIESSIKSVSDDEDEEMPKSSLLPLLCPRVTSRRAESKQTGTALCQLPALGLCLPMPPRLALTATITKKPIVPMNLPEGRPLPPAPRLPNFIITSKSNKMLF